MIYISAQQDNRYCLWQLAVQLYNFRRLGIERQAVALVGVNGQPSWEALRLQEQTCAKIVFVPDTRGDRTYAASIYFHIVAKYLAANPTTEPIFFHDGDIIFREIPAFDSMLGNDTAYMSDTDNYLGPRLYAPAAIEYMTKVIGIDTQLVYDKPVGGAQYLLKTHDHEMWRLVETRANTLFHAMQGSEFKLLRGDGKRPDQWLSGMWALLWTMYERDTPMELHPDLKFTWPVYDAPSYGRCKILHNAGVQPSQRGVMFHKGSYTERSPFYEDLAFVSKDYASIYYAREVTAASSVFNLGF